MKFSRVRKMRRPEVSRQKSVVRRPLRLVIIQLSEHATEMLLTLQSKGVIKRMSRDGFDSFEDPLPSMR